MKAVSKILAGGVGLAALVAAAPAAAQYYPNPYPQPYPYGQGYGQGGGLGAIIDQILGGNRYAYGADNRMLVNQCIAAVTDRIARTYGRYNAPYGGQYGNYGGYNNAPMARVLGITDIDRRSSNRLRVRGVATAGQYAMPYGQPYGQYGQPYGQYGQPYGQYGQPYGGYGQQVGELTFRCDVDYRGRIRDIDINRNRNAYGYYGR